jgi:hypothetical protein
MTTFSFGEFDAVRGYKTLDERVMRGSAGIMLALAMVAIINGFILKNYIVLPFISGFLVLNFLIGLLVSPKFSPTVFLAKLLVRKQSPLPIGAVQKRFAWSLGLILTVSIFVLSLLLQSDGDWFTAVCELCIICAALLYLETAFGICVGCKLYQGAVRVGLLKEPEIRPNCMGDTCEVEAP